MFECVGGFWAICCLFKGVVPFTARYCCQPIACPQLVDGPLSSDDCCLVLFLVFGLLLCSQSMQVIIIVFVKLCGL
jgi:hypothetical protein